MPVFFSKEIMRDCDVDISLPQLTLHSERNKERKVFLGEVEQRGWSGNGKAWGERRYRSKSGFYG